MSEQQFYKVLDQNGHSCHGGTFAWSLPVKLDDATWAPGDWTPLILDIEICRTGYHLTTNPEDWRVPGMRVFEAQPCGAFLPGIRGLKKSVFARVRLLRERPDLVPVEYRSQETQP